MPNIFLPKYKEVSVETNTFVKGKWKIEIVHPNGEVSQPLGDKMRPNLIQDAGIRLLCGHDRPAYSFDGSDSGGNLMRGIPDVISHAAYSSATANPTSTTYNGNLLGSDGGWSSRNTTNTCTRVDTETGCIYTKVWDFNAVQTGQHQVREIAIGCRTPNTTGGLPSTTTQESGYGKPSNFILFSRFVLPPSAYVTIDTYQFLRLTYTLEVSIPATITPIEVPEIVSGSFSTLGKIKCVGSFARLFGEMNPNGTIIQRVAARIGVTDIPTFHPWALIPPTQTNGTYNYTGLPGAALLNADDEFGNNALTIDDYAPNVNIPFTVGSSKSATRLYNSLDIGGTVTNESYTAGSNSCSKSAAIFFPATIPNTSAWMGGLFFSPQAGRYSTSTYTATDPLVLGIDTNGRGICVGWVYNFYDALGNRRAQFKDINFALRFNYTQTVTR